MAGSDALKNDLGKVIEYVPINTNELTNKDRMTAIVSVVFEHPGYEPVSIDHRCAQMLQTFDIDPVVKKRVKVPDDDWTWIKYGDIEHQDVGLIVIENRAGMNLLTKPTEEELAKFAKQIIRIRKHPESSGSLRLVVLPGMWQAFSPEDAHQLQYKSDFEVCPAVLSVYPR